MANKTFKPDPAHTRLGFAVKHMMVTTVRGHFDEYDGEATIEGDDHTTAVITGTIKAASVNTGVGQRDDHLRSDDFFGADAYPEIKFVSTSIEPLGDERFRVRGDLTIRDVTKPIELEAELTGPITDPYGNERVGVSAHGKIKRLEWGLKYNPALEAGGFVVGDEVRIEIEGAMIAVKDPATTNA
jgi:polyisoprenoid-binding protein YceI